MFDEQQKEGSQHHLNKMPQPMHHQLHPDTGNLELQTKQQRFVIIKFLNH